MEYRFKTASDYPQLAEDAPELTLEKVRKEADWVFETYLQHSDDRAAARAKLAPLHERIITEFFAVKGMSLYQEKPWSNGGRIFEGEGVWLRFELVFGFHSRYFSEIAFELDGHEVKAYAKVRDGRAPKDKLYSRDYHSEYAVTQPHDSIRSLAGRVLAEAHEQIRRISKQHLEKAKQRYEKAQLDHKSLVASLLA